MRTTGIKAGDVVLVIERHGEQYLVRNGLVESFSMDEALAGTHGEPAIKVGIVMTRQDGRSGPGASRPMLILCQVVHISHRDFVEGLGAQAYEELPRPASGVCRYCKCTDQRACPDGCSWIGAERTVCSNPLCVAKFKEYMLSEPDAPVRA
jgi:hypothetical protein